MNVVELFHILGRRTKLGDFTKLSLAEQGDVMRAANSGYQLVYNALPEYFKELTEGFVFPAPVTVSFAVTQYSNAVATSTFSAAQIGRTVVIDGDPAWNQIIDEQTLLNPYNGTSATVNATIYGDAVYSTRFPFKSIMANPKFADQSVSTLGCAELIRWNSGRANWFFNNTIGRPLYWDVQPMGNSQGNDPLLILKVRPVPETAYVINVRMAYWPKRITMADYNAATTVPVPDQFLESALIPISMRALMNTRIWDTRPDDGNIKESAKEGEAFVKNQASQVAAPNNRVLTPFGY